jgi:GT2 family glycosyltransferase
VTPGILLLLVNYHHEEEVLHFIRNEVRTQTGVDCEILVCDNGSDDPVAFRTSLLALPGVRYYRSGRNLGYFGAAAQGLDDYLSDGRSRPDWVVISNTDVEFPNRSFLGDFMDQARGALVAAPAVHSVLSGHQQNPFSEDRYSVSRLRLLHRIYASYPAYLAYQALAYLKRAFRRAHKDTGSTRDVYALHGTFLAFSREYFEKGGTIRYGAFLFGEELFVAEQVRRLGGRCRYIPELQLEHREHASTGRFKSPRLVQYMRESTDYLLREVYRD